MLQDFDFAGIVGASACYTGDMNIDCQRAVNFYPERVESSHAKKAFVLRPTQGYRLERDFGAENPIRGMHRASRGFGENEVSNALVVVAGAQVWAKPGGSDAWAQIGTINDGTETVSIADDGVAMLICDNAYAWRIKFENPEQGFHQLKNEGEDYEIPIEPSVCAVAGSYTVISGREINSSVLESNRFYVSGVLDNSEFGGLDFYTGASFFSPIRALAACGGILWLMGDDGIEAWQTTGNSNQPMMPVSGMFYSGCGIMCKTAFATSGEVLFWLGQGERGNAVAYIVSPAAPPKRVSTVPIEEELQEYEDLESCVASCFSVGGHTFFILAFKDSKKTWVYDLESGMWHERQSGPAGWRRAWDPLWIKTVLDTTYGANPDGKLYVIGSPELGEDGEPILRRRTCPSVDTQERRALHQCLAVSLQSGTGDFKIMLRSSDDNGYTWGATRTMNFSQKGKYKNHAQFRMLGMARRRVYELQISDPVGVSITRASIAMDISGVRS